MTLTSHGNLNLKGGIHHYGDCRTLSVVLVSSEISAFSASLREVIASNEKMNYREDHVHERRQRGDGRVPVPHDDGPVSLVRHRAEGRGLSEMRLQKVEGVTI